VIAYRSRDALNPWILHIDHSLNSLMNRITSISSIRSMLTMLIESRITIVKRWIDTDQFLSLETDQNDNNLLTRKQAFSTTSSLTTRLIDFAKWLNWHDVFNSDTIRSFTLISNNLSRCSAARAKRIQKNRFSHRSFELFQICFIIKTTRFLQVIETVTSQHARNIHLSIEKDHFVSFRLLSLRVA
jgi:hypothetical protein